MVYMKFDPELEEKLGKNFGLDDPVKFNLNGIDYNGKIISKNTCGAVIRTGRTRISVRYSSLDLDI